MLAWLLMLATHEFGHVIHVWLSGGIVQRVILHPLAISRTDVNPNPHPLFVAWGGAVSGTLIPMLIWAVLRRASAVIGFLAQFFLGFCLIANGAYLAIDVFYQGGDGRELIQNGCPIWIPATVGSAMVGIGLIVWHRLGPSFGFDTLREHLRASHSITIALFLITVIVAEVVLFRR